VLSLSQVLSFSSAASVLCLVQKEYSKKYNFCLIPRVLYARGQIAAVCEREKRW